MATAIAIEGVTRWFGDLRALDDVHLDVPVGQVTGLLGHNGAGKTTLTRLLTGILAPHGGSLRVLGLDPQVQGREVRLRAGVLGEAPGLDDLLTVRENLEIRASVAGLPAGQVTGIIDRLLEELGILEHRDRRVRGLSAGLRQRVALARALVTDPELLLLDEPATNMDPVAARQVRDLMRAWAHERGRTVVVCTHDLREAAEACDNVAILEHGRVLAFGSPLSLTQELGEAPTMTVESDPEGAAMGERLLQGNGRRVDVTGQTLTVAPVARDEVPDILRTLVEGGVPVYRVDRVEPSLADAYVALHRRGVRA